MAQPFLERCADLPPLWMDNLYLANSNLQTPTNYEAFVWSSRDTWMTNVTMHALGDTTAAAVFAESFLVAEGEHSPNCLCMFLRLPTQDYRVAHFLYSKLPACVHTLYTALVSALDAAGFRFL
jgi:hypothetical protein